MALIGSLMKTKMVTAGADETVAHAAWSMARNGVGAVLVLAGEELQGILSERDCLKTLLNAQYHELPTALVQDLMSTEVETIGPESDLLEIAHLFLNRRFRRLPVVDEDQLVGQISRRDVLRAIQQAR